MVWLAIRPSKMFGDLAVSLQCTSVTDKQTDRHTPDIGRYRAMDSVAQ